MKETSPVGTGKGKGDEGLTSTNYSSHKKTLSQIPQILDLICERGRISEPDLFLLFQNRRIAIEFVRWATSGRYYKLTHQLQNGQRYYFPTRYACRNRLVCGVPQ